MTAFGSASSQVAVPAADEPGYGPTSALLGAVIALSGSQCARERYRVRPDRARLEELEGYRADAVLTLRSLVASDAGTVGAAWHKFEAVYLTLLAHEPHPRADSTAI